MSDLPSTEYAESVHGVPMNPINVASPLISERRVLRIFSMKGRLFLGLSRTFSAFTCGESNTQGAVWHEQGLATVPHCV